MLFSLFTVAFILATLIGSFFHYAFPLRFFVGFVAVFEGHMLLMSLIESRKSIPTFSSPYYFNPDEVNVLKTYPLFFKFPAASRDFSAALSAIQLSSFVWVPWLIYQAHWIEAIVIGANFFIAGRLSMKLNPILFLSRATGIDSIIAAGQLGALQSALEKVLTRSQAKDSS
jgi:hypothetical protein